MTQERLFWVNPRWNIKKIQSESPLTFFSCLQVLNSKINATIQNIAHVSMDQTKAQYCSFDTMTLNTLLTGLRSHLGHIILLEDPKDLLEAQ